MGPEFHYWFQAGMTLAIRALAVMLGLITPLLAVLAAMILIGMVFDRITTAVARRWTKKGIQPKGKAARVILDYYQRNGRV